MKGLGVDQRKGSSQAGGRPSSQLARAERAESPGDNSSIKAELKMLSTSSRAIKARICRSENHSGTQSREYPIPRSLEQPVQIGISQG